jgi:short-subunit dehydrogenase
MSSGAGFIPVPGCVIYGTSKYGVFGLSENLRIELASYGIGVTVVGPASVKTDMTQKLACRGIFNAITDKKGSMMEPEYVAKKIVKATKKNKFILLPGVEIKIAYWIKRFSQRFFISGSKFAYKYIRNLAKKQGIGS